VVPNLLEQLQAGLGTSYRIERELGGGGMSRVFLAEEIGLGRRVVVKVLPSDLAPAVSGERFRREIQLAAQLQHPHIIPLLTAGELAGGPGEPALPYFTMPFVEGESLRTRLARGGELPIADVVHVLREVGLALAYAHEHGVVHRDVKPDNVLLSGGAAMVTDFGVAKALAESQRPEGLRGQRDPSALTSLGLAIGTPAYMAPEQAAGDPGTDHRADLYAFGVLAYELLTGQPPFAGRPAPAVLAAHATERVEAVAQRRPACPPALAALIMRCLEKRPADRPQSAREIVHQLDALSTPTGMTPNVTTAVAAPPRLGRNAAPFLVAAVSVVAVLALAAYWRLDSVRRLLGPDPASEGLSQPPRMAAKSIAVLPFVNMSADPENEYFSDGMTEELINALARVPGLEVAARTSSFAFKGKNADVREIAEKLKVQAILEGSVRRSGNHLRVTAQLIDAANGYHLWSDAYARELTRATDVFAVQEQISQAIADHLKARPAGDTTTLVARPTTSLEAYTLYLKGRFYWERNTQPDLERAAELFQQAIAKDSAYAVAYAGLSDAFGDLGYFVLPRDVLPKSKTAALRALELDSTLAEAHTSLAGVLLWYDWDWAGAEKEFRRAIALKPGLETAHRWYGFLLIYGGRAPEGVLEFQRALALAPLSVRNVNGVVNGYRMAGRYDLMPPILDAARELDSNFVELHTGLAWLALHDRDDQRALAEFQRAVELSQRNPQKLSDLAYANGVLGHRAEALRLLEEIRERARGRYLPPSWLAEVYAGLGDADRTVEWLGRAIADRSEDAIEASAHPAYARLRSDPRFVALMKQMGAPNGKP
jgi:serine/threonine-protein kinase